MSEGREQRRASNETAFREVNERVEELAERRGRPGEFVCECSDIRCTARIHVPIDEYERVRRHGRRFIVVPGHEQLDLERVIDVRTGWLVVEKRGEAGEVAEQADPRDP